MDDQSGIKNNTTWVRCQSKSRPGVFYLFNKKTGETRWCSESLDKTQQNNLDKCKMKTPAQDRLKRLQKDLDKTKHKDLSKIKAKDGSKNRKLDFSSEKKALEPMKIKPVSPYKEAFATNRSQIYEASSTSKPTTQKSKAQIEIVKDFIVPTQEQKNTIQVDKQKFRIPKKPCPSQTENISKKKAEKRKHNEVVIPTCSTVHTKQDHKQSTNDSSGLRKEIENVSNPKKLRISNELETNPKKRSPEPEKKIIKCDLNDNIESSKDQKSTIMSVVKDYCSSLFKKVVHSTKEYNLEDGIKQSNLSHNSKPSFKSKKPLPKASNQENHTRRLRLTPQTGANLTLPSSSTIGCANDRLQRLRRSLQDQQTTLNRTKHNISSPASHSLVSTTINHSVCSPSSSHLEIESMDWQPILEDSCLNNTISSSVSNVSSSNVSTRSEHYDTINENLLRLAANKKQQERHWKTDYFYFVVDTNVFLENVTFVDELIAMKLCDTAGTVIYIPYCVLQELDKLKIRSPSESIKTRSTRAIHFINKAFEKKSENIQAQSSADENKHLIKVTSPDDSILNCCLQVKEHIENIMLLTEDINLRNKAICSDILVSTKSDLISKHESLL